MLRDLVETEPDPVEAATRIATRMAGTPQQLSELQHREAHDQRDEDRIEERRLFEIWRTAKYKGQKPKPERIDVLPEFRDGMSDAERAAAVGAAHLANVTAASVERHDEAQQHGTDYYDFKEELRQQGPPGGSQ